MVIPEVESQVPGTTDPAKVMAHPIDRMAAFFVDVGLLFLVGSLIVSPLQKRLKSAQLLSDSNDAIFWILAILLVAGLIVTFYQFLTVALMGATVGKRVFGLQVVDLWSGKRPDYFPSFVRATVWWLDTVAGCLPHLAVYSDQLRRPLHDRVSNTIVISVRGRHGLAPLKSEQNVIAGIFVSFYILGFGILIHEAGTLYTALDFDDSISVLEALAPSYCEDVSDQQSKWPIEAGRVAPRVSIAMALFAAGKIEEDCLDREAYVELRSGDNQDLAYLARAFASSDESDLSDRYLTYVCEVSPDGEACEFSKLIDLWTQREWDAATAGFKKLLPESSVYVKAWAIKHFEKIKDFESELNVIEAAWPLSPLADFMAAHRTVALWGLDRHTEAETSAKSAIESLSPTRQVGLASWMCFRQSFDCQNTKTPFCKVTESAADGSGSKDHDLTLLSLARVYSCRGEDESIHSLSLEAEGSVQDVLRAISLKKSGQNEKATILLREAMESTEADSAVHHESARLLAEWSDDAQEVQDLALDWLKQDRIDQFDWKELGRTYGKRLANLKDGKLASRVQAKLNQQLDSSQAGLASNVSSGPLQSPTPSRQPASDNTHSPASSQFEDE